MCINISIILLNSSCHSKEIIWANGDLIEPGIDHLCHLRENIPGYSVTIDSLF